MNKRRYFLPLAVGVLTVAVTGGVIFAQTSNSQESINSQIGTSPQGLSRQISSFNQEQSGRIDLSHGDVPSQTIAARVAAILEIEEEALQDAFDQALKEKQDDSLAYRLEHLVENEKLTQAEADQIVEWFLDRPDAAAKLHRALLWGGEAVERRLNHLVEGGVISQKEADAVLAWHGEMPQALKDLMAQRMHRSPDSKSQGRVRPSQRFQGQDMDRSRPESRRVDLEGFTERDIRRPGARSERRNNMPEAAIEGAGGLDQAGLP